MSVNIILPMWLSIVIGIIIAFDLLIHVIKLIPKSVWFKVMILLFYKNNKELYEIKRNNKKAMDKVNAKKYIKRNVEKRIRDLENKESKS